MYKTAAKYCTRVVANVSHILMSDYCKCFIMQDLLQNCNKTNIGKLGVMYIEFLFFFFGPTKQSFNPTLSSESKSLMRFKIQIYKGGIFDSLLSAKLEEPPYHILATNSLVDT